MEFKTVHTISQEEIIQYQTITNKFPSYSDFNLLSILCWNTGNNSAYSISNNGIAIRIKDYLTPNYIYSYLGETNVDEKLEELLKDTSELRMVPELTLQAIKSKNNFHVSEDVDSFDYIIDLNQLAKLEGGKYKELRRHTSKFQDTYGKLDVKVLNLELNETRQTILELTKDWAQSKRFTEDKVDEDLITLTNFLKYSKFFKTLNLGLFINDKLIAFTLNEILSDEWTMGHFGKSSYAYKNSSKVLEHYTSKYLASNGYKFMNIQQDTGIKGLRTAKMALRPAYFFKKYKITFSYK